MLVTHTIDDLEALVDKAIQMETKRKVMLEERKRRMMSQGGSSSQRTRNYLPNPRPAPQPPRAPAPAPRPNYPIRPNYPNRANDNYRPGGNDNNANRPNVVCFESGVRGHYSKECPNLKNAAPRPNATIPNRGPGRGGNGKNAAPRGNAAVTKGRLHHINVEEAQDAPDVVLGTFLVNSVPATASYHYVFY